MTEEEKLQALRIMVGKEETDELLSVYLDIAGRKILNKLYPYDEYNEVPDRYLFLQCEIAAYLINKRGAEGQINHSENGISRVYENADIPESMLRNITPYCGTI